MSSFKLWYQQQDKNKRLAVWLAAIALCMFGFGFALVPIYNVLCKAIGINGKTSGTADAVARNIDKTRTIEVRFLSHTQGKLPWKFHPTVQKITLHPGENKRVSYFAENNANTPLTVQAIPSVTPGLAAKYLKKTECFCFTQQTLKGKTSMEMPILFHIDKDLPEDVHEIVLSYTLFDVTHRAKKVPDQSLRRITSE